MGRIFCDAHLHFNFRAIDPADDLLSYQQEMGLKKSVLILNTRQEIQLWRNASPEVTSSFIPVVRLDRCDPFIDDFMADYEPAGQCLRVKIHPRLSTLQQDEASWYLSWLKGYRPATVIVDDFPYGNEVDWHWLPTFAYELATCLPESSIVLAHAGGVELLPHVMRTKTQRNIFYDISLTVNYLMDSSVWQDMVWLLKFHAGRVMLGSDYPDFTWSEALSATKGLFQQAGLTETVQERVLWKNANEVYQLGI